MEISINNANALLEECITNGEKGSDNLYAWFLNEKEFIKRTIIDLSEHTEDLYCEE